MTMKKLNVHSFPRPPAVDLCQRRVKIVYNNTVLAESSNVYWVLETHHPPTYYIPPTDVNMKLLTKNSKSTYCEWKGVASYYNVALADGKVVESRCWSYPRPMSGFTAIKDHISFYAGPWDCYVNDELVKAQPGDFYGGYMTSDIDGGSQGVKGGPGTWGW